MGRNCPQGEEYDAGLCYPECPDGFYGVGPVCWSFCPANFSDTGAFCEKPNSEYGRGTGWFYKSHCEASDEHGAKENGCEEYGGLYYPICDEGYYAFGCCICSPDCPAGMKDIGIACAKATTTRGVGTIPSILSLTTIYIIIFIILAIIVIYIFLHSSNSTTQSYPRNNNY